MSALILPKHEIGAGYNQPVNNLTIISTIKPTGDDRYFPDPQVIPHGFPGVPGSKLSGMGYLGGYAYIIWLFGVLTYYQYMYLRSTYCNGGFFGEVTIFSAISGTDFARYNAIIDVPRTGELQDAFFAPRAVGVKMKRLVPLT